VGESGPLGNKEFLTAMNDHDPFHQIRSRFHIVSRGRDPLGNGKIPIVVHGPSHFC